MGRGRERGVMGMGSDRERGWGEGRVRDERGRERGVLGMGSNGYG